MTRVFDRPEEFAETAIDGLVASHRQYLARVDGGVIRSTVTPENQVAVIIGGGSGHYPAFAGLVGAGLAAGSVCGNLFASPSTSQVFRVAKAAQRGGGVLLSYGNYAGDVLHFGEAERQLNEAGIPTRTVRVTDDIASAPIEQIEKRRGIAGDLTVFKIAGAAAERGDSLDEVVRVAEKANLHTRSLGVAFGSPTLPGAEAPLFSVPEGQFSLGLGIHGEPGISEHDMLSAKEFADLIVGKLLEDKPEAAGTRVAPILNGLGTVKYEELFVLYTHVEKLLVEAGLEIVEPEVGELVTSLDMAGLSLTLFWLDEELETLWSAPADTPAFRKGAIASRDRIDESEIAAALVVETVESSDAQQAAGAVANRLIEVVRATIEEHEEEFGRIDAIAGDGDHGIGMRRGAEAAAKSARESVELGRGVEQLVQLSAENWAEKAGGTSGALWGAAITAVAKVLSSGEQPTAEQAAAAARAGLKAITDLGKAEVGDKTLVDALVPFVETFEARAAAGDDVSAAFTAAATAARDAADATAQLRPLKGRARPLAEKSIGHPDAGAVSLSLIVTAVAEEIAK